MKVWRFDDVRLILGDQDFASMGISLWGGFALGSTGHSCIGPQAPMMRGLLA